MTMRTIVTMMMTATTTQHKQKWDKTAQFLFLESAVMDCPDAHLGGNRLSTDRQRDSQVGQCWNCFSFHSIYWWPPLTSEDYLVGLVQASKPKEGINKTISQSQRKELLRQCLKAKGNDYQENASKPKEGINKTMPQSQRKGLTRQCLKAKVIIKECLKANRRDYHENASKPRKGINKRMNGLLITISSPQAKPEQSSHDWDFTSRCIYTGDGHIVVKAETLTVMGTLMWKQKHWQWWAHWCESRNIDSDGHVVVKAETSTVIGTLLWKQKYSHCCESRNIDSDGHIVVKAETSTVMGTLLWKQKHWQWWPHCCESRNIHCCESRNMNGDASSPQSSVTVT